MPPLATTTPTLIDIAHAVAYGIEEEHPGLNAGVLPWEKPCIIVSRAEYGQDPDDYYVRRCCTVTLVGDKAVCEVQALNQTMWRTVVSLNDPDAVTKITAASVSLLNRLAAYTGGAA